MKICGMILAILYACIMLLAVWKEKKKNIQSALIAGGSFVVLAYSLLNIFWKQHGIGLLIVGIAGMAAISFGALLNGIRQKNLHITHHLIRLVVEGMIIALCAVGR